MVKILKCYLIPKKSYDTLSKGAIFFGQPCIIINQHTWNFEVIFSYFQKKKSFKLHEEEIGNP